MPFKINIQSSEELNQARISGDRGSLRALANAAAQAADDGSFVIYFTNPPGDLIIIRKDL